MDPVKIMERLTRAVLFFTVAMLAANLINITIKWSAAL